jgi:glutathione S-transferase/tRNA A-37 threonylcarbamoyl transferase component Bud32
MGHAHCWSLRIALQLLHLDVEEFEMDFDHLPAWFFDINPLGTVPAIQHGGTVVVQLGAIMEYFSELSELQSPRPPVQLYPSNSLAQRSRVRSMVASLTIADERLMSVAFTCSMTSEMFVSTFKILLGELQQVEASIGRSGGPFILGASISAADIVAICIAAYVLDEEFVALLSSFPEIHIPRIQKATEELLRLLGKSDFTDFFNIEQHLQHLWRYYPVSPGCAWYSVFELMRILNPETTLVESNKALLAQKAMAGSDYQNVASPVSPSLTTTSSTALETMQQKQRQNDLLKTHPEQCADEEDDSAGRGEASTGGADSDPGATAYAMCADSKIQTTGANLRRRFALLRHESIGRGASATVYKAFDLWEGRYIAVKEAAVRRAGSVHAVQAEIRGEFETLLRLRHPGIVAVIALEMERKFARIYMEWMPSGSLAAVVRNAGPLPEATGAKLFRGLLEALAFTHEQGVVHRDIKPLNMLMAADGAVKLSDFGTAMLHTIEAGEENAKVTGTINYMSPDVISGIVDPANDMWALGVSLNEVLAGEVPWAETGMSGLPLMFHIGKIGSSAPGVAHQEHPRLAPRLSARLVAILESCMAVDRRKRPSAKALLEDPYFAK